MHVVNMSIHLQVETALPGVNAENQAVQEMTLEPYLGFDGYSKNYLHISVGAKQVAVGSSLNIKLYIKTASPEHRKLVKQLTYVVSVGHFGKCYT